MTAGQLAVSMSAREEMEWLAFFQEEPFGGPADDYRAGTIAAAARNAALARGQRAYRPSDFFPGRGGKPTGTLATPDALKRALQARGVEFRPAEPRE